FSVLMEAYLTEQPQEFVSGYAKNIRNPQDAKDDMSRMENLIYNETPLTDQKKLLDQYLSKEPAQAVELIKKDKAFQLYADMADTYNRQVAAKLNPIQERINQLQRTYMKAQMEVMKEKKFYPDANSTLRLTYG